MYVTNRNRPSTGHTVTLLLNTVSNQYFAVININVVNCHWIMSHRWCNHIQIPHHKSSNTTLHGVWIRGSVTLLVPFVHYFLCVHSTFASIPHDRLCTARSIKMPVTTPMKLQWTAGNKDLCFATSDCDGVTCSRLDSVCIVCDGW